MVHPTAEYLCISILQAKISLPAQMFRSWCFSRRLAKLPPVVQSQKSPQPEQRPGIGLRTSHQHQHRVSQLDRRLVVLRVGVRLLDCFSRASRHSAGAQSPQSCRPASQAQQWCSAPTIEFVVVTVLTLSLRLPRRLLLLARFAWLRLPSHTSAKMAAPAQSGWIEWTPAGSNPGNGRGDPPPIPDQMNAERGHALIYTGGLKVSPYSLPEHNSKGYHSVPTPMLSTACKRHFNVCSEFNHFLNHLRPFQFGQGLQATYLNSSTCVWISATGEKPTSERGFVQYAQGKGMLKTKSGTILYEGDFDQGFRHGQGFSQMEDLSFGFGTYQGAWVWGCRQGWGKFTLDSDGKSFAPGASFRLLPSSVRPSKGSSLSLSLSLSSSSFCWYSLSSSP